MIREWRHLKMLKRAGRALLVDGATQIQEGALAVECPACPHPGRNMPSSIEEVPQEDRYVLLWRLILLCMMLTLLLVGYIDSSYRSTRTLDFDAAMSQATSRTRHLEMVYLILWRTGSISLILLHVENRRRYVVYFTGGHNTVLNNLVSPAHVQIWLL